MKMAALMPKGRKCVIDVLAKQTKNVCSTRFQSSGAFGGRGMPPPPGMRGPQGGAPGPQQQPPTPQLIGIERPRPAAPKAAVPPAGKATSSGATKDVIVEVDASNFTEMVLKAKVGVILDVYADWCQPCKQLTPMLERVASAAQGGLRLAKLNADKQQQLAAQLGVKSLPTVFGVVGGRVVDSFTGLVPETRLREFLEKTIAAAEAAGLVPQPGPGQGEGAEEKDVPTKATEALAGIAAFLEHGRAPEASVLLSETLVELMELEQSYIEQAAAQTAQEQATAAGAAKAKGRKTTSPVPPEVQELCARTFAAAVRAHLQLAQAAAAADDLAGAAKALDQAARHAQPLLTQQYKTVTNNAEVDRGVAAAHLAKAAGAVLSSGSSPKQVVAKAAASPTLPKDDPAAALTLAAAHVAVGDLPAAVTVALDVVRHHPTWSEGAAAEMARRLFAVLGEQHTATAAGRKRLAKLLFR